MCEVITTYQQRVNRADPTRTIGLRRAFIADLNKRFRELRGAIRKAVIEEDVFGLQQPQTMMTTPGERSFAFMRDAQKVAQFMTWMQSQINAEILGVVDMTQIGTGVDAAWSNKYIYDSYERGVQRANVEMRKAGYEVPKMNPSEVRATLQQPFHADRLGVLYTRTFTELKGVTDDMAKHMTRVLSQGMADGHGPRAIARNLNGVIKGGLELEVKTRAGITRLITAEQRARMIARTEMIRAHHVATIQEYRNWEVEGVRVHAEWNTAGDDRVCDECLDMEGTGDGVNIYTLDEIEGMIPKHPNCFIDGQIPIYTSEGWKPIAKVEIGDYVLTHEKRFQKVYALPRQRKQRPNVVTIGFEGGLKLTITENHLMQIEICEGKYTRWIKAGNLKIKHKPILLANKCEYCGELTAYFRKYCSRTCLSKHITERQWKNPEHRKSVSEKNRKSMLQQYELGLRDKDTITKNANKKTRELVKKGQFIFQNETIRESGRHLTNTPEHRKASSERMKQKNPMWNPKVKEKARQSFIKYLNENPERRLNARMAKYRKSGRKTWIEQRMADLLDKIGIDYVFQYPILNYDVDFAIPSLRIVVECDGEFWHKDKEKDKKRQKRIEKEGWFVLRYTGKKINQCLDDIEDEMRRVVGNHAKLFNTTGWGIRTIEKWQTKRNLTLYNLSVENDESYIAKGLVVHNCRCIALPTRRGVTK